MCNEELNNKPRLKLTSMPTTPWFISSNHGDTPNTVTVEKGREIDQAQLRNKLISRVEIKQLYEKQQSPPGLDVFVHVKQNATTWVCDFRSTIRRFAFSQFWLGAEFMALRLC